MKENPLQYRVRGTPVPTTQTRGTNYPKSTGVSNKNPQLGYGEIISSAFGLLASVSAVLTLFSRKSVRDTSIEALVKVADQVGELELRGKILAAKYRTLTERRGAHKNQLFWLRFGYGSLLLAVLAAMLPVLLGRF